AIHVTVNSLGERTGNASLGEVAANIHDNTECETHIVEKKIISASKLVETFSGKRVAANTPIVGQDVFTQTSGIHADGDKKANLYANPLLPERFGRKRTYALGKLSGKASLDQNLTELGIELTEKNKKKVLQEIIQLGDKKESITIEDLPFIIADVLEIGEGNLVQITDCIVTSGKGILPTASFVLRYGEQKIRESASGNGGYDAFMYALKKACSRIKLSMPELIDYEVRIPPGGKTSALVETLIVWSAKDKVFKTIGVDSDQIIAAIKASERMLNIIAREA
ncbi:2-isopropylmalate synthase, partial [bacterium]|nr:2-isopropylmalate synthase [bacterium]